MVQLRGGRKARTRGGRGDLELVELDVKRRLELAARRDWDDLDQPFVEVQPQKPALGVCKPALPVLRRPPGLGLQPRPPQSELTNVQDAE